jgi:hypothetical protein
MLPEIIQWHIFNNATEAISSEKDIRKEKTKLLIGAGIKYMVRYWS